MKIEFNDGRGNVLIKSLTPSQLAKRFPVAYSEKGDEEKINFHFHPPSPEEKANCKEGYVLTAYWIGEL